MAAVLLLPAIVGCGTGQGATGQDARGDAASEQVVPPGHFVGQLADTLLMGAADNAEVVKAVPGTTRAILVSSKARKLSLLEIGGAKIEVLREHLLFENDPSESETTSLAVAPDGTWAVCTRTIIQTDDSGAQTDCGGELVFFDATDSDKFGEVLGQLTVGPMPDSVAISDDGKWAASANERDGPDAWGKCEVPGEQASVSIVSLEDGPSGAAEYRRITMVDADTGPREPESVIFGTDNDLVVATLQDSHEVLFVRLSQLESEEAPTSASDAVTIVRLPDDAVGAGPWPDGVGRCPGPSGSDLFVTAGEWNDTFAILDGQGKVVSNSALNPGDIPESFPRVIAEGSPRFSPDSVATFQFGGVPHVAFTLRHSGAVVVYELSDPAAPAFASATAV